MSAEAEAEFLFPWVEISLTGDLVSLDAIHTAHINAAGRETSCVCNK